MNESAALDWLARARADIAKYHEPMAGSWTRDLVVLYSRLGEHAAAMELVIAAPDERERDTLAFAVPGACHAAFGLATAEDLERLTPFLSRADAWASICLSAVDAGNHEDALLAAQHLDLTPEGRGAGVLADLIASLSKCDARRAFALTERLSPPKMTPFGFALCGLCREGHVEQAVSAFDRVEDRLEEIEQADVMEDVRGRLTESIVRGCIEGRRDEDAVRLAERFDGKRGAKNARVAALKRDASTHTCETLLERIETLKPGSEDRGVLLGHVAAARVLAGDVEATLDWMEGLRARGDTPWSACMACVSRGDMASARRALSLERNRSWRNQVQHNAVRYFLELGAFDDAIELAAEITSGRMRNFAFEGIVHALAEKGDPTGAEELLEARLKGLDSRCNGYKSILAVHAREGRLEDVERVHGRHRKLEFRIPVALTAVRAFMGLEARNHGLFG